MTTSAGGTGAGNIATVAGSNGKVIRRQKTVSADANKVGMFARTEEVKPKQGEQVTNKNSTRFNKKENPYKGKLVGEHMKDQIKEGVLDATDEDGWMAKEQLYKISQYATKLHQMIGDTDNLEPWIQAKITKAADYMSSIKHYIEYEQINPHPTDEPAEDASMDAALELAQSMESADPRIKKGMNRIFDSAQNDLANSLVK